MKTSLVYRVASGLLVLFALGHTIGFQQVDPRWGIDSIVGAMRSTHFEVQGFDRTYWDFYAGFGFFVTVLLLFAAALAWQLGGLPRETLAAMPLVTWGFAVAFGVVTALSWTYFFTAPVVSSAVVTVCLVVAAWLASRA